MTDEKPDATRPPAWRPLEDAHAARAVPMPAWAREFARTGKLPSAADRRDNDPGGDVEERGAREDVESYERHWRGIARKIDRMKSDAAALVVRSGKGTPVFAASLARGFELDEEYHRLFRLHAKRAPLMLRDFPPIDGSDAGRSVDRVERDRSREPLFGAVTGGAPSVGDALGDYPVSL